jgi:hypothetical protein
MACRSGTIIQSMSDHQPHSDARCSAGVSPYRRQVFAVVGSYIGPGAGVVRLLRIGIEWIRHEKNATHSHLRRLAATVHWGCISMDIQLQQRFKCVSEKPIIVTGDSI